MSPPLAYGRASALSGNTDHTLVERLREICASAESAMAAATRYDQNFELKLADCKEEAAVDALLSEWLHHRVDILQRTVRDLKRVHGQAVSQKSEKKAPRTARHNL